MSGRIKSFIITTAGITLVSVSTGLFYLPNHIVTGGVSGISTILYQIGIPPGLVFLVINIFLLLISYRVLGKRFVINSLYSVFLMSVLVQFFSVLPPVTTDILLATVYGSVLFGLGAAMAFIENSNTGGTDIVGRLIQVKYPYLPIGRLLMIVDGIIILSSLLIFHKVDLTLYGILALFLSTFTIDFVIGQLNLSKLAFVISEKGEEISKKIVQNSRRGVTVLDAKGAYSGKNKKLLVCALKNREIPAFHKMITDADSDAFIIFSESDKIFGEGFFVYK